MRFYLAKITPLAPRKSHLVIICNSHENMTKSVIRSSWNWCEHCSKSFVKPLGSHLWSLVSPIHKTSWPKSKLGKVGVGLNIAQNHSSGPRSHNYLVIIFPKSHKKLTNSVISASWESVRKLLEIIHLASKKSYIWPFISGPNSHGILIKF